MSDTIVCYRCGTSLAALTLPLSRRDLCPGCHAHVHVCRMCVSFDADVLRQCLEDDADDVNDKDRVNFCDWFKPQPGAYDGAKNTDQQQAESALAALFGDTEANGDSDNDASSAADDLFK